MLQPCLWGQPGYAVEVRCYARMRARVYLAEMHCTTVGVAAIPHGSIKAPAAHRRAAAQYFGTALFRAPIVWQISEDLPAFEHCAVHMVGCFGLSFLFFPFF